MRCNRHDLACGPDGRCVLCRREGEGAPAGAGRWAWLAAAVAFAAAGVAAYRSVHAPAAQPAAASLASGSPVETAIASLAPASGAPVAATTPVDSYRAEKIREYERRMAPDAGGFAPAPTRSTPAPPETATAAARAPAPLPIRDVHVVVYTASWCPHCKRAKAWMASQGIAYEEYDVEQSDDAARRARALNPRGGVPTFDVDGQAVVGFSEASLGGAIRRAAQLRAARPL